MLRAGAALALPRDCAGCGRQDQVLCRRCVRHLGEPVRCEQLTGHLDGSTEPLLPTWALAAYTGAVRHAILAWKSGGRPDLAEPLTTAIARAARTVALQLPGPGATVAAPVLVVPAPSAAHRRRSGRFVVGELADAVGGGLAGAGGGAVAVIDPLRRRAATSHLLDAAARGRDRSRAVRCLVSLPGARCLLVDDVVTTGATLAACARALRESGATVLGAVTLAVTMPPGASSELLRQLPGSCQRDASGELLRGDGRVV